MSTLGLATPTGDCPINLPTGKRRFPRLLKRSCKRLAIVALLLIVPLLLGWYIILSVVAGYVVLGLMDVLRNTRRTPSTLDRYFFGNGFFTWLLAPFNLLLDLLCLPFRNRGVYSLADLPAGHRAEIEALIAATQQHDLLGQLAAQMGDKKRGMIFFQWYGKNLPTSINVPEFHRKWKYIRTIGVSIFNKKQSTGKHYGPLRITLRVLYNINTMEGNDAYIRVGSHTHYWSEDKLFIFDDTLQHRSVNETDGLRACMFVDILRPSYFPWLTNGILTLVRWVMSPIRAIFYQHWTFIR